MSFPRLAALPLIPAFGWFLGCPLLLFFSVSEASFKAGLWWDLYFLAVTVMSPVTFAAFAWDKWRAKREKSRVPEKTLHIMALVGGWPGAVLGQNWFRHKTLKPVFRGILLAICGVHIAVAVAAFLFA